MVIHLGLPLLTGSSSLPGSKRGPRLALPYLALLRTGFTVPPSVTGRGGALLPHRFTLTTVHFGKLWRSVFCGTFPGSPPPDVIRRSALCSPDFPRQEVNSTAATIRTTPWRKCRIFITETHCDVTIWKICFYILTVKTLS